MNKDFVLNVGDKIYYKNVLGENKFGEVSLTSYDGETVEEFEKMKNARVIKVMRPTLETVYERKEILDDVEKEYLIGVIKPFRDKIEYIAKYGCTDLGHYISIQLTNNECIDFPYFKDCNMYKGMLSYEQYTLEELGL